MQISCHKRLPGGAGTLKGRGSISVQSQSITMNFLGVTLFCDLQLILSSYNRVTKGAKGEGNYPLQSEHRSGGNRGCSSSSSCCRIVLAVVVTLFEPSSSNVSGVGISVAYQ